MDAHVPLPDCLIKETEFQTPRGILMSSWVWGPLIQESSRVFLES